MAITRARTWSQSCTPARLSPSPSSRPATCRTGCGAYNVEPSPDGRWVIVTNKKDRSVSLFDAATLTEAARIPTSKQLPHGIAYAPDGRFAFVSLESVGADPGGVDVIDLTTKARVASTPIPLQPTGIAILRRP